MGVRGVLRTMEGGLVAFMCPGCRELHQVRVAGERPWGFNDDYDRPTFTPSVLVRGMVPLTDEEHATWRAGGALPTPRPFVCHSFVTAGQIRFLGDCTHALAGQTVPLTSPAD